MQNHHNLEVYKEAHAFAVTVYREILKEIPRTEPLRHQLWRAASSIPLNIVEGTGRKTQKDFASYLYNSVGSARECEEIFCLCRDTGVLSSPKCDDFIARSQKIQKMLISLIQCVNKD